MDIQYSLEVDDQSKPKNFNMFFVSSIKKGKKKSLEDVFAFVIQLTQLALFWIVSENKSLCQLYPDIYIVSCNVEMALKEKLHFIYFNHWLNTYSSIC